MNETPGWYKPKGARKPHWFSGDSAACGGWSLFPGAVLVSVDAVERKDGCQRCNTHAVLWGDVAPLSEGW